MAGIDPAQIAQARAAGYSDAEIADHLASTRPTEFKTAREAGYTDAEILTHLTRGPDKPSGIVDAARQGLSGLVSGPSATLKEFAGVDMPTADANAKKIAPEDYKGASFMRDGVSAVPQMVAEGAPGLAQDMLAYKVGSKFNKKLGALAGASSYLLRTLGGKAQEDAAFRTNDPNAPVETQDKVRAVATAIPEAALNSLSLGVGGTAARAVGTKGVVQAGKDLLAKTAAEAGTEGAQALTGQVGKGLGTDRGVAAAIDPNEIIDNAVAGGATRGLIGTPRAVVDAAAARKYSGFGGANEQATADVADMSREAADGANLANPKAAFEPLRTVEGRVRKDVREAAKVVKGQVSPDAADALDRASKGRQLTDADLSTIENEAGPDVAQLVRRAHVVSMLKEQGTVANGRFTGGLASSAEKHVHAYKSPYSVGASGLLTTLGLSGHAGSMFAYGLPTLATLGGAYAAMRGIDKLSGNRSPLNKFVQLFETGGRPAQITAAPAAPEAPPRMPGSVPSVARRPDTSPWGRAAEEEPTGASVQQMLRANAAMEEGMGKIAGQMSSQRQAATAQAEKLLRELAAQRQAAAPAPQAPEPPVDLPGVLKDTKGMLAQKAQEAAWLQKMQAQHAPAPEPTPAPAPQAPEPPVDLPGVLKDTKGMLAQKAQEAAWLQKMQAQHAPAPEPAPAPAVEPTVTAPDPKVLAAAKFMMKAKATEQKNAVVEEKAKAKEALALQKQALAAAKAQEKLLAAANKKAKPTQAVEQPVARPAAPKPAKITKAPEGEVKVTAPPLQTNGHDLDIPEFLRRASKPKEEAAAATADDYTPLKAEELFGKGMSDEEFADHQTSAQEDVVLKKRYSAAIVKARKQRRNALADATGDLEIDDQEVGAHLLEELHHLRRREKAIKAINHFTSKMTPEGAAAVRAKLTKEWVHGIWSK
jgi:hypothetical protein